MSEAHDKIVQLAGLVDRIDEVPEDLSARDPITCPPAAPCGAATG
jgi:hypothetical protein